MIMKAYKKKPSLTYKLRDCDEALIAPLIEDILKACPEKYLEIKKDLITTVSIQRGQECSMCMTKLEQNQH